MDSPKYVFNHKTLSYEKYKSSIGKKILHTFFYFITTCVFAFIFLVIAYNFFGSPKERMQEREISYLKLQYQILGDRLKSMETLLSDMQDRDDNIYRVIFEAEPIPSSIRKAGYGGIDRYEHLQGYSSSDLVTSTTKQLDLIASQLYIQSKSFDEVFDLARNKSKMLSSIPAIQPVNNMDINRISSYFGNRTDPFYKVTKFHQGVDFSAPVGTEIYSTGDGKVVVVEKSRNGYGNQIIIDHGFGYKTRYCHLQKISVRKNEEVKRGQLIGTVGNTGKSSGPHLHYEVLKNDRAVNPIHFFFNDLTPEEYDLILEKSMLPSQTMD